MIKKTTLFLLPLLFAVQIAQSQVLIALIFGDKLNSDKLKFGLDGGANFSNISNISGSKYHTGFNLGFYFDILLKEKTNWYIHTGVLVKSPFGADNIAPYPLGNADLDSLFAGGSVDRKLRYFNVPILIRYKFKNQIFLEGGPMLGLLYKAYDEFQATIDNPDDLTFENKIVKQYRRIDVGGMAGVGYHLLKGNGMNFGIRYYYGFMDIIKDNPGKAQHNSNIYLYASIPIGAGEKAKEKQAEKAKEKAAKKKEKEEEKARKEAEKNNQIKK